MALVPDDYEDGDGKWYFSKEEIEENSPSRRHGITLEVEKRYRKEYSIFLRELGMKIEVPQLTIATATLFCHRFFKRKSHAKHNGLRIATSCLLLASKVEETPKSLRNVTMASFELTHRMDSENVKKFFKMKGVYRIETRPILNGERRLLKHLGSDFNVMHPYKPLALAIQKFMGDSDIKDLVQLSWNFVNDGLKTSLPLQFKPRQVAAAAYFLAVKQLKLKLHPDWRREFAVDISQFLDIYDQFLELYDTGQAMASGAETSASKVLDSGAETSAPKVLDGGDNASTGIVAQAINPHNLDDSDSGNHKIASDQINYDQQSTKPGQSSPNQGTLTTDFEPKSQQEERIETLEQKDFDQKAEQEERTETLKEKEKKDVPAVNQLSPATIERLHKKFKATMEERKKSGGSDSSRVRVPMTEDEIIEMLLEKELSCE